MSCLYGLARFEHLFYELKILPFEIAANESGFLPLAEHTSQQERPLVFRNVSLLDVESFDGAVIVCQLPEKIQHYRLQIEDELFDLTYFQEPRPVFSYGGSSEPGEHSLEVEDLDYFGPFAVGLSRLPISPPTHELARRGAELDPLDFPLFRPIDNLAYLAQKILWVISLPSEKLREAFDYQRAKRIGEEDFSLVSLIRVERWVNVGFISTSHGVETRLDISAIPRGEATGRIAQQVYASIQPWHGREGPVPHCDEKRVTATPTSDGSHPPEG